MESSSITAVDFGPVYLLVWITHSHSFIQSTLSLSRSRSFFVVFTQFCCFLFSFFFSLPWSPSPSPPPSFRPQFSCKSMQKTGVQTPKAAWSNWAPLIMARVHVRSTYFQIVQYWLTTITTKKTPPPSSIPHPED